ncbi:hypothetical protein AB204_08640 [Xenorhabdus khoisanae]|uniref:Uncharacterized protein n=1 Tax=Xenorhabdus khoisanae TaxID=880157 RepID=A0A0J5IQS8_9GAMM|nr:hypothetical protein AB204_08640 [Xenorhabdus khoisanae]
MNFIIELGINRLSLSYKIYRKQLKLISFILQNKTLKKFISDYDYEWKHAILDNKGLKIALYLLYFLK